ncbi:DUF3301 domain-containing protein [Thalassotalea sp. 1_MG-2023]|uniref:DUF3301 domain-containing protein n=1 Tax=Thalassotalea sp. 1_MG-2023 TaxID=3062680 RepID=UPI0026E36978|nr:DUF3301 domain-containing protein [Thalassotalea sp. 1_MG-2023]MDO6428331.1 DUF3301 domain-containing protein [Thalassotalea sp. 1_MG-2023]
MGDFYIIILIFLIFWFFIFQRKVSETAKKHVDRYCQQEGLQFISVARRTTKLSFSKRYGPYWQCVFDFEFSGDGESTYTGVLSMANLKLENIITPAHRI